MNYEQALTYLEERNKFGWKPGLERIELLLEKLGNPHRKLHCIHVGGTNGKGSVTTTLARILKDQGYRVGQFISPEMFDVRERVQVNEEWIPREELIYHLTAVREAIEEMEEEGHESPTNFEVWTTLGFLHFQQRQVDLAVIEVGLGGAIDSTNVIDPLFSIITNVSIDHKDYLGETVEEIAAVKSGIIKKGRPVITGSTEEGVLKVIEAAARAAGSRIFRYGLEFEGLEKSFASTASSFIFQNPDWEEAVSFSLVGHHQVVNGSMALEAVWLLSEIGYEIDFRKAIGSMREVFWPGRLEFLQYKERSVLLDAAHNLEGARNLALALRDIYEYRHLTMMVGILGDKDRQGMIDLLGPFADRVVVTRPPSPRADDYSQVASYFRGYCREVEVVESITAALERSVELTAEGDLLCITGSIYMLQEIRGLFGGAVQSGQESCCCKS